MRTDPTQTEELTEWNGVSAMSGVGGSILEVVVSVCGFVVNGSGYLVVGNRNTKVQLNGNEDSLISKVYLRAG